MIERFISAKNSLEETDGYYDFHNDDSRKAYVAGVQAVHWGGWFSAWFKGPTYSYYDAYRNGLNKAKFDVAGIELDELSNAKKVR